MADSARPARSVLVQRLVLLGLLAPIVALGVVFWLLLPGGAASASFSPGEFSRAAQLDPPTWAHREVSLRGYLAPWCSDTHGYPAHGSRCGGWLLLDSPMAGMVNTPPSSAVHLLPLENRAGTICSDASSQAWRSRSLPATTWARGSRSPARSTG